MDDREYYRLFNPTPTPEKYDGQREFEKDPVGMIRALRIDSTHGKNDWGDTAIDVLLAEIDGLNAALAALKSQLAVRQTDRELLEEIIRPLATGEIPATYEDAQTRIVSLIATHVAAETEPWRKRCEEAEGNLKGLLDAGRTARNLLDSMCRGNRIRYPKIKHDPHCIACSCVKMYDDALLATHPATGEKDGQ